MDQRQIDLETRARSLPRGTRVGQAFKDVAEIFVGVDVVPVAIADHRADHRAARFSRASDGSFAVGQALRLSPSSLQYMDQ